ncbi:hypothetical protein D030_2145B, partial [Vibrio parahaemolyticus AQ3810]
YLFYQIISRLIQTFSKPFTVYP